jgi:hypothetical protein
VTNYILIDHQPVACDDVRQWAKWFEHADRRVAHTVALWGLVEVSTVFLGIDHGFSFDETRQHVPVLFETMAFWLPGLFRDGQQMSRCCTWDEALVMHKTMLKEVRRPDVVITSLWEAIRSWRRSWSFRQRRGHRKIA